MEDWPTEGCIRELHTLKLFIQESVKFRTSREKVISYGLTVSPNMVCARSKTGDKKGYETEQVQASA